MDSQLAAELVAERFGPGRLRRPRILDEAGIIAERRRILLGEQGRTAGRLRRDQRLALAIRRWSA